MGQGLRTSNGLPSIVPPAVCRVAFPSGWITTKEITDKAAVNARTFHELSHYRAKEDQPGKIYVNPRSPDKGVGRGEAGGKGRNK